MNRILTIEGDNSWDRFLPEALGTDYDVHFLSEKEDVFNRRLKNYIVVALYEVRGILMSLINRVKMAGVKKMQFHSRR